MPYKGGTVCISRSCPSKSSGKNVSMFRIPRDPKRAQQWLKNADRRDLQNKTTEELVKNYRLCEVHFESKWFTSQPGDVRKRLLNEAVPTLFARSELEQLQVALDDEPPKKVIISLDNRVIPAVDLPTTTEDTISSNTSHFNAAIYQLHAVPGPSEIIPDNSTLSEVEIITPD